MIVPPSACLTAITDDPSTVTTGSPVPEEIQQLLDQFKHLFAEPVGLPPKRDADHKIPLIPGAQPVKVRPYRYSPIQKTKIEK